MDGSFCLERIGLGDGSAQQVHPAALHMQVQAAATLMTSVTC